MMSDEAAAPGDEYPHGSTTPCRERAVATDTGAGTPGVAPVLRHRYVWAWPRHSCRRRPRTVRRVRVDVAGRRLECERHDRVPREERAPPGAGRGRPAPHSTTARGKRTGT